MDHLFDLQGGDGVQGGAGFIHQDHLRLNSNGAGNAEALLLTTGEGIATFGQLVLGLIPKCGLAQRALHQLIHVAGIAIDARTKSNVLVDALGEGIGLLEHHADAPPHLDRVNGRRIHVVAIEDHPPLQ